LLASVAATSFLCLQLSGCSTPKSTVATLASHCEFNSSAQVPTLGFLPPRTALEVIGNVKTALDNCYFLDDDFLSDRALESYFGDRFSQRHVPGPGYTGANTDVKVKTGTAVADVRFEISRFETPLPGDPPGLRVSAIAGSLETFAIRIDDL